MKAKKEIAFLCVILVCCCFYVSVYMFAPRPPNANTLPNKSLERYNINNGDLIFITGENKGERSCRWFTNSEYCHVGMLFNEYSSETNEMICYVIDCDLGGKHHKNGVRITSLKDKLSRKNLNKTVCIRRLVNFSVPTTLVGNTDTTINSVFDSDFNQIGSNRVITSETIMYFYRKYSHVKFDKKMLSWFLTGMPVLYDMVHSPDRMFCSEFMSILLEELGVIIKDKPSAWYSPNYFQKSKIQTTNNFLYLQPEYFTL